MSSCWAWLAGMSSARRAARGPAGGITSSRAAAACGPAGRGARCRPGRTARRTHQRGEGEAGPRRPGNRVSTTRHSPAMTVARMARRPGGRGGTGPGSRPAGAAPHPGGPGRARPPTGRAAAGRRQGRRGRSRAGSGRGRRRSGPRPRPPRAGRRRPRSGPRGCAAQSRRRWPGCSGQVPAVGPVGVGLGGDRPPGRVDGLIVQVGPFGQAQHGERVRDQRVRDVGVHRAAPGRKKSPRSGVSGDGHGSGAGSGSWRGAGSWTGGGSSAGGGRRLRGERLGGRPGRRWPRRGGCNRPARIPGGGSGRGRQSTPAARGWCPHSPGGARPALGRSPGPAASCLLGSGSG